MKHFYCAMFLLFIFLSYETPAQADQFRVKNKTNGVVVVQIYMHKLDNGTPVSIGTNVDLAPQEELNWPQDGGRGFLAKTVNICAIEPALSLMWNANKPNPEPCPNEDGRYTIEATNSSITCSPELPSN